MFPHWVRIWDQYSLLLQYGILEKLVTHIARVPYFSYLAKSLFFCIFGIMVKYYRSFGVIFGVVRFQSNLPVSWVLISHTVGSWIAEISEYWIFTCLLFRCPLIVHYSSHDLNSRLKVVVLAYILSKIVLAGLQALLSPANAAELSWACGRVFHHVF